MAQAQKQVRIIEPLERFVNRINLVGCYARVSSDSEDQLNSYNNQVDFYESYINSLENSKLVKIYTVRNNWNKNGQERWFSSND